jgi:hypothetical protein
MCWHILSADHTCAEPAAGNVDGERQRERGLERERERAGEGQERKTGGLQLDERMAFVVRAAVVRHGADAAGRREPPTQVVVVHRGDVLTASSEHALSAAMSLWHDYRTVDQVDESALALLRTLSFPGKREVLLLLKSPRDVDQVLAQLAVLGSS